MIEDNFSTLDNRKWLLHPGGTKMPVCGSSGDALVFIEKAYTRYVISTDVVVNEDSFLQFDFAASCSVTDSCYGKYLLDLFNCELPLGWLYRGSAGFPFTIPGKSDSISYFRNRVIYIVPAGGTFVKGASIIPHRMASSTW